MSLKAKLKSVGRWQHQDDAVAATVRGFKQAARGQVHMPCGTGKTRVGLRVAQSLKAQAVLVAVPSIPLITQTLREWRAHYGSFDALAVCHDETAAEDGATTEELVAETEVTTNVVDVVAFLKRPGRGRKVVFSTHVSAPVVAAASKKAGALDLVIVDEAHRVATENDDGPAATLRLPGLLKADRFLYMTATPYRMTDDEEEGMSEEYGPVFYALSFAQAVERGLLCDYQVVVIGVTDALHKKYVDQAKLVQNHHFGVLDARTLATHVAVNKAIVSYGLKRLVSFHGRIARARAFAVAHAGVTNWMPLKERPAAMWQEYVAGSQQMKASVRHAILTRLREAGEWVGLVSNARCLAEGVDVPALDGVVFADPKNSIVDIVQAVGRVMRTSPGKTVGTVVVPIFIAEKDIADLLEGEVPPGSPFQTVGRVLRALRSHDPQLGEELDAVRGRLGTARKEPVDLPQKVVLDLPVEVGVRFASSFRARIVRDSTSSFPEMLEAVRSFVLQHGRPPKVPAPSAHEAQLGRWVLEMRRRYVSVLV